MKRICLIVASLCALAWAGAASADTYTPIQIQSAGTNADQQMYVTWIAPNDTSLVNPSVVWDNCTGVGVGVACPQWTETQIWGSAPPNGPYTIKLTDPMTPPADASAYLYLAVQVSAWDQKCTWLNHGIVFSGCENYSPWVYFKLTASCTQNLVSAGHYVIVRKGHYLKQNGHYVRRHGHRVWIKPVRRWVAPVYGDPTCVWVNA